MIGWIRVVRAFCFAAWAHRGQKDMEGRPYLLHLVTVAWVSYGMTGSAETAVVGLLHDYVEDVDPLYGLETLRHKFGWQTAAAVKLLTKERGVCYDRYIERLCRMPQHAWTASSVASEVKIADLLHNTRPARGSLSEYKLLVYGRALRELLEARVQLAVSSAARRR